MNTDSGRKFKKNNINYLTSQSKTKTSRSENIHAHHTNLIITVKDSDEYYVG